MLFGFTLARVVLGLVVAMTMMDAGLSCGRRRGPPPLSVEGQARVKAENIDRWIRELEDSSAAKRRWAAHNLGTQGPDGRRARPALEKATRDPDPSVVRAAHEALKQLLGTAPATTVDSGPAKR
jgi:hypothetical protein